MIFNYNVAMATFPTVPKWHPGLKIKEKFDTHDISS